MKRDTVKFMTFALAASLALTSSFACAPGGEDDFDAGSDTSDAAVQDSAVTPTCADYTGQACDDSLDRCEGELLLFCDNGHTVCNDCASENPALHCALWTVDYGHECLAGAGQSCADNFPNNDDNLSGCDPAIGTCSGGTCN